MKLKMRINMRIFKQNLQHNLVQTRPKPTVSAFFSQNVKSIALLQLNTLTKRFLTLSLPRT